MTTGEILYLMIPLSGAVVFAIVFGYLSSQAR